MQARDQTSTGHDLSTGAWLDDHYQSSREEYEDGLRWVGIQPGWRVLDAGCGGGGFLPLLCELAGAEGHVTAMDLAPENIARVEALLAGHPAMRLSTRVGSLLDLPFGNGSFDCVWTANVFQYLSHPEIDRALSECRRVLTPGGLLAVKEYDSSFFEGFYPLDEDLVNRWRAARRASSEAKGVFGSFHSQTLLRRFRAVGLTRVRGRGWLVERRAPLPAATRALLEGAFKYWFTDRAGLELSPEDRARLGKIAEEPDRVFDDPDFCFREGFIVAVGTKPDEG